MSSPWPPADRPEADAVRARQSILVAAASGDIDPALAGLGHDDPRVRATAVIALHDHGALDAAAAERAATDDHRTVRRAAAQCAATAAAVPLDQLLVDTDDDVVEMACWAAGEWADSGRGHVAALIAIGTTHDDALCREAAIAALGAIGDPTGLPAILHGTNDKATVRRRAVLALAPFDGPEVDAALETALADRDWQVRQAAEDLLGA